MRVRAGWRVGVCALATIVSACSGQPEVPVRQHFFQQRLMVTDPAQPCVVVPGPPMEALLAHDTVFVPVKIDGVDTIGKLDTGGSDSLITPWFAAAAHLKVQAGHGTMMGVTGGFKPDIAFPKDVQIGTVQRWIIGPVKVYPFGGSDNHDVGALVGLDWLDHFDYDIDLAHQKIRPFLTSNCALLDPPWRTTSTGLAITRGVSEGLNASERDLATTLGLPAHLSIPVAFTGGIIDATLDTGAPDTLMSHQAAIEAGVTEAQLSADPIGSVRGINGKQRPMIRHVFADMAIGEQEIHDFPLLVAPSFDRDDDPMVLGIDYLGKHHFWLSLTTNALYIDSGETRRPAPPYDQAHTVGGNVMPAFPQDAKARSGYVEVVCSVGADGSISQCRITKGAADPAFGRAVMFWLTSGAGPVMQPRYINGRPVAELHRWAVNFAPR